jgi:hypothetical protein
LSLRITASTFTVIGGILVIIHICLPEDNPEQNVTKTVFTELLRAILDFWGQKKFYISESCHKRICFLICWRIAGELSSPCTTGKMPVVGIMIIYETNY